MKHILIAFTALLLLSGCKAKESLISSNTSERNDSITTVIAKDTVVKWLPQKQEVKTNQKSKLSTDFSFSNAWIDSTGLLNHSIENFPLVPSKIITEKVIVKKLRIEKHTEILYITNTEKIYHSKTNWFGKFDFGLIGFVILFLLWKLKVYFKI